MSDGKKGISPWFITVLMGTITLLFAFYAFQQQEDAQEAEDKMQQMEAASKDMLQQAKEAQSRAEAEADRQRELAIKLQMQLDECLKKRK